MTQNLTDLIELARDYQRLNVDYVVPMHTLFMDGEDRLFSTRGHSLASNDPASAKPMTRYAFGQLWGRLGTQSGVSFLWDHASRYPGAIADITNRFLEDDTRTYDSRGGERHLLVRTRNEVRGVLSKRYTVYDNVTLLRTAARFMGDADHEILRGTSVDPDSMYFKTIVHGATDASQYGVGITLINDEIGRRAIHILPMIQRNTCWNSIVLTYSKEEMEEMQVLFRIPHITTVAELDFMVHRAMAHALRHSLDGIEDMARAEQAKLPSAADIVKEMVESRFAGDKAGHVLAQALFGMESQLTVAGVVNGLSWAAHAAQEISTDQRAELEVMAGAALGTVRGVNLREDQKLIEKGLHRIARTELMAADIA